MMTIMVVMIHDVGDDDLLLALGVLLLQLF